MYIYIYIYTCGLYTIHYLGKLLSSTNIGYKCCQHILYNSRAQLALRRSIVYLLRASPLQYTTTTNNNNGDNNNVNNNNTNNDANDSNNEYISNTMIVAMPLLIMIIIITICIIHNSRPSEERSTI